MLFPLPLWERVPEGRERGREQSEACLCFWKVKSQPLSLAARAYPSPTRGEGESKTQSPC
jgi:hypothetical protein